MTYVRNRSALDEPFAAYEGGGAFELSPDDRVGEPFRAPNRLLRSLIVGLAAMSCLWIYLNRAAIIPSWVQEVISVPARTPQTPVSPPPSSPAVQPQPQTAKTVEDAPLPKFAPQALPESANAAAAKPEAASEELDTAGESEAAPEPIVLPAQTDPLQKRAVAAGLHPDISRAVLSRLTARDFSNAAIGVQKALTETPDGDVLTWPLAGPRAGKGAGAVYTIHFVRGSSPDCRRYVVTITLSGWDTTALPMETCGIKSPRSAAGQKNG